MPTVMPGRDTCNGSCETEMGCACVDGCGGLCHQGRRTCQGKPLPRHDGPMERMVTRLVMWLLIVMLMLAAVGTAVAAPVGSWDQPGVNPYRGSRWAAVQSYTDMPLVTRIILGLRIQHRPPDVIMRISKNSVTAADQIFLTDMIGMHFGRRQRYDTVDRSGWPETHVEHAAGWCWQEWCVGSPYVCGNVFAIMRQFDANTVRPATTPEATRTVSEPASITLGILALLCAVGFRREAVEGA